MPPSDQPIANVWALISLICTHLLNLMPPEDSGENCLYRTYDSGLPSTSISRSGASPSIKALPSGAKITSQEAAPPPAPSTNEEVVTHTLPIPATAKYVSPVPVKSASISSNVGKKQKMEDASAEWYSSKTRRAGNMRTAERASLPMQPQAEPTGLVGACKSEGYNENLQHRPGNPSRQPSFHHRTNV